MEIKGFISDQRMSFPTSPVSPLGQKEEGILQQYFLLLNQFAFDKAKELIVSTSQPLYETIARIQRKDLVS